MINYNKLKRTPYMSKRMFIIKTLCENNNLSLEYLFGLFNHYNNKNKGKWFWQKATFSGPLKEAYDKFNDSVDNATKEMKNQDEKEFFEHIQSLDAGFEDLLVKMEMHTGVERMTDQSFIEAQMDNNLRALIKDGLRGLE